MAEMGVATVLPQALLKNVLHSTIIAPCGLSDSFLPAFPRLWGACTLGGLGPAQIRGLLIHWLPRRRRKNLYAAPHGITAQVLVGGGLSLGICAMCTIECAFMEDSLERHPTAPL